MGTIDEEAASKFINALIKSLQTLCHGYLDFDSGIEIIGHINLNVDKIGSLDYILKEKVCKNNENSTLFISNSFHAQPKSEQTAKAKNSQSETVLQRRQSSDSESGRVSSAISSISSALSSAKESPANSTGSRPQQSTAKRKAHDDFSNDHRPAKSVSRDSHHFLSSHSQPSPHDTRSSSPIDSKPISGVTAGFDSSHRTSSADGSATMLPQTANVTSDNQSELDVNLEGSVLERVDDQSNSEMPERDDSDLDLEVTFIKEEFVEGERSACEFQSSGGGQQYGRTSHHRASSSSDGMGEQPLFPVALHSSASATYVPGSQDMVGLAQHYAGSHVSSASQPQPGPSGMRGGHGLQSQRNEWLRVMKPADEKTDRQTKWAVKHFKGWLVMEKLPTDFEGLPPEDINNILSKFFLSARKKNGDPFSSSALIAIRTALTRYLNGHPFYRNIKLAQDSRFTESNSVLQEQISLTSDSHVRQVIPITPEDHRQLYQSGVLNDSDPTSLLYKVWFELQWHFGRLGGRRTWSAVPPDSFVFNVDVGGEYVTLRPTSSEDGPVYLTMRRMYAIGGVNCPVRTLKKYLGKRNPLCSAFLQTPKKSFLEEDTVWFLPEALKEYKVTCLMKHLSKLANLSKDYTNLSVSQHLMDTKETDRVILDDDSVSSLLSFDSLASPRRDIVTLAGSSFQRSEQQQSEEL